MSKKPDRNRALTQNLCSPESISVPHSLSSRPTPFFTPAPSTFPIYMFLLHETCEQKAKYHPELPSISALIRSSTFHLQLFFHHHSPHRWLKRSPFPNPTSAQSRLSFSRNLHADAHRCLSGRCPVPFVNPLFMGLERRRALDPDGFRLEMTWMG